jgi:pyruvate dehydrogenase E2 component (dihydrolipoamide acetyltransferase)
MIEFRMPTLGADMEAGTLVEWMVKPGDSVKRGQVVAVVETQKGAIEVEIWETGTVQRLVVEPGAKVPVGTVLAVLDGGEAPATSATPLSSKPVESAPPTPAPPAAAQPETRGAEPRRRRISPAARKRAEELHIPIDSIESSAPDAAISVEDVERVAGRMAVPPPGAATAKPRGDWRAEMRKAIAAAMSRSKREIPHYYLAADIDVTDALAWLERVNSERPLAQRLLPATLFMKAVALALHRVPGLNGLYREGAFEPSPAVHLGMAIAMRGGGLVAPAIHDAHAKNLDELMAALRDLIERVRSGRLRSSELADPTVTLTTLGDSGVDRVYGVIYPPQVAIVGLGKVTLRPGVTGGAVLPRQIVCATLAADHRVSDGHLGARLLTELEQLLRQPELLEKGGA